MLIQQSIDSIDEAFIDEIVAKSTEESLYLDFKRELPDSKYEGKRELVADVSAFANSSGGYIFFGIEENKANGQAQEVIPLVGNPDGEERRIQDIATFNVSPRIPGLRVKSIPYRDRFVLVIRIPKSSRAPHRNNLNNHFYVREGRKKRELDVTEIGQRFIESKTRAQQVVDFRSERIDKVTSNVDSLYKLKDGPLLMVHLIPSAATNGSISVDPGANDTVPLLFFQYQVTRPTADGVVSVNEAPPGEAEACSTFFRNGFLEAVKVLTPPPRGFGAPNPILASVSYENDLIELVRTFRANLKSKSMAQEMSCLLSISQADKVNFAVDNRIYHPYGMRLGFDRDLLQFPEVALPEGVEPEDALRPLFDLVWQAAGYKRSFNYDERGKRTVTW